MAYELHAREECWHPAFHPQEFNAASAQVLLGHVKENYNYSDETRIAPLCEFGGVSFTRHHDNEQASGTYAVCPHCSEVLMCGYTTSPQSGPHGLSPTSCEECNTSLSRSDYFQPVSPSGHERIVEVEVDPVITLLEVMKACGTHRSLSGNTIFHIAAILYFENLLSTGNRITFQTADNNSLRSEELRGAVTQAIHWGDLVEYSGPDWQFKIGFNGRELMEVRQFPSQAAKERAAELVSMSEDELVVMALKMHVERLN